MKNRTKILVIDNYDSFVYNLVHYLEELDCEVTVKRNDRLSLEEVEDYDKILLSPGPGIPEEAGLLKPIIETYAPSKPIFGVCLGMQAIGEVFGGRLNNLDMVYHGVATKIDVCVDDEYLYKDLPQELQVGRYHSWVVDNQLPDVLQATSYDEKNEIMSLRHRDFDVRGVQFHPESVLTPEGKKMIQNWVAFEHSEKSETQVAQPTENK
ncbi:anthranilate synthase component II [Christiangramia flava]|uniref:Anthranilate synthase, amidotransferase component n=1 Tax=Christiangramia flava JLT2011 TaxID=1229726 RepID=A0A1L7I2E8_9FLAO|nr:aminodeoxychorismate/anthranilate synthase component II [Christiangramia flava]APU67363.1 Anthranilate synthase, amidotransferase component [Christiangramia flava JLT2011]OSS39948.1 Anthranilate synthase, amidotransferase component [Christiangramia flava JLT2011]